MASLEQIVEDFEFLEDWEDRYRYVIELGRTLDEMRIATRQKPTRCRGASARYG